MTIAEVLKGECQRRTMDIRELARRAEQSPGRVHAILTGETPNPGIMTVMEITRALGKNLGWLERQIRAGDNDE